jgi:hypothetical protein
MAPGETKVVEHETKGAIPETDAGGFDTPISILMRSSRAGSAPGGEVIYLGNEQEIEGQLWESHGRLYSLFFCLLFFLMSVA